ncbi:hypothetical protein [Celeribacter litoreus]|uniref:hypothetical protein n=1 Tax=Celeribacter litoreus TaxID=2876714 RepID=UPI001CC990A6|nr:hypothetical protein [Celeribacter litoreus]MCA0045334.1 hypothetical protein [Celeribacter litoreus]
MIKHVFLVIIALFAIDIVGSVSAEGRDADAEISTYIFENLPRYLEPVELHLSVPSISTIGNKKRYIYDFDLSVIPRMSIYGLVREEGPFAIVVQTLSPSDDLNISGILDILIGQDSSEAGVNFSQDFSIIGRPLNDFGRIALIAGEEETELRISQYRDEATARAIAEMNEEIAKQLEEERAAGEARLRDERTRWAEALLNLKSEHAEHRGKIIAEQRQQISELQTGLATERQSVERQLATAQDLILMRSELDGAIEKIAQQDAAAISTFEQMRQHRIKFLQALPSTFAGVVDCKDNSNPDNRKMSAIEFDIDETYSSGFAATFYIDNSRDVWHGPKLGEIAIRNEIIDFPLTMDFAVDKINGYNGAVVPEGFQLKLQSDGRLVGAANLPVNWNGTTSEWTCEFRMSG